MDGGSYQKTISRAFPTNIAGQLAEFIMLALIGAVGVLIHAYLRMPMRLPGHQGVIYMALLLGGKMLSKKSYAASLSSIGAASMLLFHLGFHGDPFLPVIYLFPGFIVDVLCYSFKTVQTKAVLTALFCGLAFMSIPVTRILISSITGFPFGSLLTGYSYPLMMHFIFGSTGGFVAIGAFSFIRKRKK